MLRLKVNYGQLRRGNPRQAKTLTLSRQLAEHVEAQGLHSLFACLRAIHPAVVFFLSHFLQSTHIWHIAFSRSSKNQ